MVSGMEKSPDVLSHWCGGGPEPAEITPNLLEVRMARQAFRPVQAFDKAARQGVSLRNRGSAACVSEHMEAVTGSIRTASGRRVVDSKAGLGRSRSPDGSIAVIQ